MLPCAEIILNNIHSLNCVGTSILKFPEGKSAVMEDNLSDHLAMRTSPVTFGVTSPQIK
jgi:hypothetical protein